MDKAIECLATSYAFSKRILILNRVLKSITIIGLLAPMLVGGIVIGYGKNIEILDTLILFAGLLGIVQLGLSLLAIILGWENELKYAYESMTDNRKMSEQFKEFSIEMSTHNSIPKEYDKIKWRFEWRKEQDDPINFYRNEERRAMRYALRHLQQPCATCRLIPKSMKPTSCCDTCGNF